MKRYKITWEQHRHGESWVMAHSAEEAKRKVQAGKDKEFDAYDDYPAWTVVSIERDPEYDDEGELIIPKPKPEVKR